MDKVTIAAVLICGSDHYDSAKRLLIQLSAFDQVIIGDTTPNKMLKEYINKGKPFEYIHIPWRPTPYNKKGKMIYGKNEWGFSFARNQTIARVKTTHFIWIDCDDRIGMMREGQSEFLANPEQAYKAFKKIAQEAPEDIDVWFMDYVYSRDVTNNPNVLHTRERMLKTEAGWKFVYPIHECLLPSRKPSQAIVKDVQIIHYPVTEAGTSGERNMKMMLNWHQQLNELDDRADLQRASIVIGQGLWGMSKFKECADWLVKEFITKFPEVLDIEKFEAWTYVAKSQLELGNIDAAKAAALAAVDIEPGLQDGYLLLAQAKLVADEDPVDILTIIDNAARQDEPPSQLIRNPHDYRFTPFCITSECKLKLGQVDDALKFALLAQKENSSDPRAEGLRIRAADAVRRRDAVESSKALYKLYGDYGEYEKATHIFEQLPYVAQQDNEIIELANNAHKKVEHLFRAKDFKQKWAEQEIVPTEDESILSNSVYSERFEYILGRLKQALPNGGRILDVRCQDGFHTLLYAKAGYEVVGIDLNQKNVDLFNERAKKWGLSAVAVQGMFEEIEPTEARDPFNMKQRWFQHFDAVIAEEVLQYVQEPGHFLGCLGDCAKDGAPIILTTTDEAWDKGEPFKDSGSVRVFTQATFEALLKSNPEYDVIESHFLPYKNAYREHQGWQVGECRRQVRADGPIIRIYCGPLMKTFSPDSLKEGVGGSETWTIHMAKLWTQMGCQVVVYNDEKGIWDKVFYRPAEQFSHDHYSDVFISWRNPQIFNEKRPNAKTTVLMCHDMNFFFPIPNEWVERIDRIAVLSHWHEKWIVERHPNFAGKTWLTSNGISPERYIVPGVKQKHKYFYSSSPDRGLRELLDMWPQIREAIPDAELHVCYGFALSYEINKHLKRPEEIKKLLKLEHDLKELEPLGVVTHDKVGQGELAEIQKSCEAWLYPYQNDGFGGFLETFAITAVEAQAARCYPVSRINGALAEIIKNHSKWTKDWTIDHLLAALQWVASDDEIAKKVRDHELDENQEWAMSHTWQTAALQWLQDLAPKLEEELIKVGD